MPSATITSIFQSADALLNQTLFGETVTYTSYETGLSKSITMRIDRKSNLGEAESSKNALAYQALGFPSVSDVPLPKYLDAITATGPGGNAETWTVLAIVKSDSSTHTVTLQSDLRPII